MRTVLFLIQKEFLQIFRNRVMLPFILVMPVFQTLLLSFAASYEIKNISLGVVDHDRSPASRDLIRKFTASGYFKLQDYYPNAEAAQVQMAADKVDLTLEIPPHFEQVLVREGKSSLNINANAINAAKAGIALGYSGSIVRDFNQEMLTRWAPHIQEAPVRSATIDIDYANWYNPELDYKAFMVPGILGVIVSMVVSFLTAINLVREREIGTIEQINVTPIRKWQFILGKLFPFWILSLFIMSLGLFIGWLAFRIPMEGNLGLVLLFTLTFTPCMLGIGFLISNFAETQQQGIFTVWFFMVIFILMCGLFTPIDSMPGWAQWLNVINPVRHFVAFMRQVLLKGAGFADIRDIFYQVLGYAIVVNGLAVLTYRKRS